VFYGRHLSPLQSRRQYARRQLRHAVWAAGFVVFGLAIGTVGYKACDGRSWLDSVYSAAMILTGMGPASEPRSEATKVFASVYAIFSGVLFLTSASVLIAPAMHRFLHKFHLEEAGHGASGEDSKPKGKDRAH
jgi:hypothetical protein